MNIPQEFEDIFRGVELTEAQETALLGLAGRYAVLAGPRTEEESV